MTRHFHVTVLSHGHVATIALTAPTAAILTTKLAGYVVLSIVEL